MTKSTFLILAGIAASGTMFFECSDTYSSEAIRRAELTGTPSEISQTKIKDIDYHISTELIKQLEKENLSNSQSDLDFNLRWIELLKKSISEAIKKKFLTGAEATNN